MIYLFIYLFIYYLIYPKGKGCTRRHKCLHKGTSQKKKQTCRTHIHEKKTNYYKTKTNTNDIDYYSFKTTL